MITQTTHSLSLSVLFCSLLLLLFNLGGQPGGKSPGHLVKIPGKSHRPTGPCRSPATRIAWEPSQVRPSAPPVARPAARPAVGQPGGPVARSVFVFGVFVFEGPPFGILDRTPGLARPLVISYPTFSHATFTILLTTLQMIEKLDRKTPQLDTESVEWIAAREENQKKFDLPIKTLRNYRAPSKVGRKKPDKMFGIDRDGRRWRRQGTPGSMVYYYVPSLPKSVE